MEQGLTALQAAAVHKVSCTADIMSEVLYVKTTTSEKFKGDGAPSKTAEAASATLTTQDTATLYKDTTTYEFTPGGSKPDTIDFKNADGTILGTCTGTFKPAVTNPFSDKGSWE